MIFCLYRQKNSIPKVRNFIMDCSNYCPSHHSSSCLESDSLSVNVTVEVLNSSLFPDDVVSRQQKQDAHVANPKHTMQHLCKSFIEKYQNSQMVFDPTTIAIEFNSKLRRVYDMANILEGAGIIQKVDKGIYKWSDSADQNKEIKPEKNDWCCLKSISTELQGLFQFSKKGLTCHELYETLTTKRKNKINPATIRRRIYECCKVFIIAGLIQKAGKRFYNGKMTQKDIQLLAQDNSLSLQGQIQHYRPAKISQQINLEKSQISSIQQEKVLQCSMSQFSKVQSQRQLIIRKIVSQLNNEQELLNFIEDLSIEFKIKTSSMEEESRFAEIDQQAHFLHPNNFITEQTKRIGFIKRRQSEQTIISPQNNRRNIIISSPTKDKGSFTFSTNSNFCSYPSNSTFDSIKNIMPAFNIKGK